MGIYETYSEDRLTVVMNLSTRMSYACPISQLHRFWRPGTPGGSDGAWFLPGDDPQWRELLRWYPFVAATTPAGNYRSRVLAHERAIETSARTAAIEAWWAAVRATDWGSDPLWEYSSHGADTPDDPADDDAFILADASKPELPARHPRRELRAKYGTTSLMVYAESQGLPSPYPARGE